MPFGEASQQRWWGLKAPEGGSPSARVSESGGREEGASPILPVLRLKAQAARLYDRISGFYDVIAGAFEGACAARALDRLSVQAGETVLEVGFGTGRCLQRIAEAVGQSGRAHGIDISPGMIAVSRRKLERAGLRDDVEICRGDAGLLPYRDAVFDACFMSFTLELFDTPEIPEVLREANRVLKPAGRIGVASLSREPPWTLPLKLYEWGHRQWPAILDCRPIYVEQALRDVGCTIHVRERLAYLGIPVEVVVGIRGEASDVTLAT